jgi:hypothetical protein
VLSDVFGHALFLMLYQMQYGVLGVQFFLLNQLNWNIFGFYDAFRNGWEIR